MSDPTMTHALDRMATALDQLAEQVRGHAATVRRAAGEAQWESLAARSFRDIAEQLYAESLVCARALDAGAQRMRASASLGRGVR
jgi:uncharacterized protein YukE